MKITNKNKTHTTIQMTNKEFQDHIEFLKELQKAGLFNN
jgi:hypothetical protein